ncbi:unnamed protein product [Camellia sinensis]
MAIVLSTVTYDVHCYFDGVSKPCFGCALNILNHFFIMVYDLQVQQLIAELNEILAHDTVDEAGTWKKKLRSQSQQLFDFLPQAIQEQLLLERDLHGNVQVARIETEKMLIQMVETELESRKIAGAYKHQFQGQSHFFGYEGRCGLPSNFDSNYCYSLGYAVGALLHSGKTGLISSVGDLNALVEEWTVGGTALTSLMDVERRHGKFKPVIKKAMVELEGKKGSTGSDVRLFPVLSNPRQDHPSREKTRVFTFAITDMEVNVWMQAVPISARG